MASADTAAGPERIRPDTVRIDTRDVPIGPSGLTIGRGTECDLVLSAGRASRHHARIFLDPAGCWIEDLGSTNGTLVNGERIDGSRRRLTAGDRIRIGDEELLLLAGERTRLGSERDLIDERRPGHPPAVDLADRPLTIGRDPSNALVLDDPNVSRFHAVISRTASGIELRDLSSRNGTRVAGRLVSRTQLTPGTEIAVGAYRLTFTGTGLIPRDDRTALGLESRGVTISIGNKRLLSPTSIVVAPGELVAIIGESGAGKSTLLKALAGITMPTGGEVLINGEPISSRLTDVAYVPQDDIVHRLLTVREALRYAAALRLPPDTSSQEVDAAVARVLDQLDLGEHADQLVRDVSGGQRKRVAVAVELLSRPGILFLDEPATGLDPGLEKRLMELLRRLSRDSRPIVTITHSTKQLQMCDKVAVMARGGLVVFYGPPDDALEFFGVEHYDDIYTALDEHPVEQWLDDPRRLAMYPPPSRPSGAFDRPSRERQPHVLPQAAILARRYATLMLRDRRNLAILLGQVPVLALLITIGFSANVFSPVTSRSQAPTLLFVVVITAMWLGSIAAAREIVKEKSVFLRERAVGVSVSAYLVSKVVVLFVLCAVQTVILTAIVLGTHPLHAGGSALEIAFVILLLTGMAAVGIGLLASTLARSEDQATSFIPLLLIPQLLFGGSLIPLVGKGPVIKVLAAAMVSRWSFASLGRVARLNDSPSVVSHYGTLFSHSLALTSAIVAAFAVLFLATVAVRLQLQRD